MDIPYVRGSDTSYDAAVSMESAAPNIREFVFAEIKNAGSHGMTCDEIEHVLVLHHQTASARIRELSLSGRLRDTGRRRQTRNGRAARVYEAVA